MRNYWILLVLRTPSYLFSSVMRFIVVHIPLSTFLKKTLNLWLDNRTKYADKPSVFEHNFMCANFNREIASSKVFYTLYSLPILTCQTRHSPSIGRFLFKIMCNRGMVRSFYRIHLDCNKWCATDATPCCF